MPRVITSQIWTRGQAHVTSRTVITSLAVQGFKHMLASGDMKVQSSLLMACSQRLCLLAIARTRVSGECSPGLSVYTEAALS